CFTFILVYSNVSNVLFLISQQHDVCHVYISTLQTLQTILRVICMIPYTENNDSGILAVFVDLGKTRRRN
ncbi:hypothetical protein L9F63_028052, partial [Diploptera punctata]